jgi:hypothetical protein
MVQSGQTPDNDFSLICSYCGKIIKRQGNKEHEYHTPMQLNSSYESHGICPDCLLNHFPREHLAMHKKKGPANQENPE